MFQELNGALLQTVAFGSGARTLVAHGGWTGGWELWQQPFELLSSTWRCVGFDHRGAGESPVSPDDITMESMLDDLWAVLDSYEIDRCILAAESMGSLVAMAAAIERPDRFDGLVLVAAPSQITAQSAGALVAGSRADYPATVAAFVSACLPEPDTDHLARLGRHIMLKAEPESAARLFEAFYDVQLDPARITVPAILIHGTKDRVVPASQAQELAAAIPDATLHLLDGIGHTPTLTAAPAVARIIEERFGV